MPKAKVSVRGGTRPPRAAPLSAKGGSKSPSSDKAKAKATAMKAAAKAAPEMAVHPQSRRAKQMHKAAVRRDRLDSRAGARERPEVRRMLWFRDAILHDTQRSYPEPEMHVLVSQYLARYDETLDEILSELRPGASLPTNAELMRTMVQRERDAYVSGALKVPNLFAKKNVDQLRRWSGDAGGVSAISTILIRKTSTLEPEAEKEDNSAMDMV